MASKSSDSKPKASKEARPARGPKAPAGTEEPKPKRTGTTKPQPGASNGSTTTTATTKAAAKAAASTPRRSATVKAPAAASVTRDVGRAAREEVKQDAGKRSGFDRDALATIRKRLTEQRAQLQDQLTAIEESALGLTQSEMSGEVSYDEDYADAGSFTFEREKEFSIANNVSDLRDKIDRALHKIADGSYGVCESCGKPIEAPRLKALPHVTLCLKCKKAEERR
jgi:DnaK suppressor protein